MGRHQAARSCLRFVTQTANAASFSGSVSQTSVPVASIYSGALAPTRALGAAPLLARQLPSLTEPPRFTPGPGCGRTQCSPGFLTPFSATQTLAPGRAFSTSPFVGKEQDAETSAPGTDTLPGGDAHPGVSTTVEQEYDAVGEPMPFQEPPPEVTDIAQVLTEPVVQNSVADLLDASFLPIRVFMQMFEHAQAFTGAPWWETIIAMTIAIRLCLFPVTVFAQKSTAAMHAATPEMQAASDRFKAGMAKLDHQDNEAYLAGVKPLQAEFKVEQKRLRAKYGFHPVAAFAPMIGQAATFMCYFFSIRNLSYGLTSFQTGGAYWFPDLSVADPLYILPVVNGLSFLAVVESNSMDGQSVEQQQQATTMKMFFRILAVAMVPISMSLPTGVCIYWITSNCCSMIQGPVLKHPGFREKMGLMPLKKAPAAAASPAINAAAAELAKSSIASEGATLLPRNAKLPERPQRRHGAHDAKHTDAHARAHASKQQQTWGRGKKGKK